MTETEDSKLITLLTEIQAALKGSEDVAWAQLKGLQEHAKASASKLRFRLEAVLDLAGPVMRPTNDSAAERRYTEDREAWASQAIYNIGVILDDLNAPSKNLAPELARIRRER